MRRGGDGGGGGGRCASHSRLKRSRLEVQPGSSEQWSWCIKMCGAGKGWIALVKGKGKLRTNEKVERNESIAQGTSDRTLRQESDEFPSYSRE